MRRFAVSSAALGLVAWVGVVAVAGPRDKPAPRPEPPKEAPRPQSRADKLFDDGRRYLANKEFALACTAFEQSQEADPAIGTQMNIALCYEQWGHVASAYRAYEAAQKLTHEKHDNREKAAHRKIEELAPLIPHLAVDVPDDADPAAVLLFDDRMIDRAKLADDLLVDAGTHTIEARLSGLAPKKTTVDIANGEHKRIKVDVPKQPVIVVPPPPPVRDTRHLYRGIGFLSGGVVVLGIAGGVSLLARSDYSAALADCPMGLCKTASAYKTTQDARTKANYMSIASGVGVVLVGVGIYYLLTIHTEHPPAHAIAPIVGGDTIGLSIGGEL